MAPNFPPPDKIPGVIEALRWLLGIGTENSDHDVLARARASGLINIDPDGHWKAEGATVLLALNGSLQRLPAGAASLGIVIRGLGELAARCHEDLDQPLIGHLRVCFQSDALASTLDVVADGSDKARGRFWLDAVAFAQAMTGAKIGWDSFQYAASNLRASGTRFYGDFGLIFAIRVVLAANPDAVDIWIGKHPNEPVLAAVGRVVTEHLLFEPDEAFALSLLKSRRTLVQCLGAAFLIYERRPEARLGVGKCWQMLVDAGIEAGDAIWMVGARLKDAIHQRYGLEDRIEKNNARLDFLRRKPEAAVGGLRNAAAEISRLQKQSTDASDRLSQLVHDIDTSLCEMAACWPAQELSEAQMQSLEHIFMDTPEFRYRLAEKLPDAQNRRWLLDRNVLELRAFIGLTGPVAAALEEPFYPDEKRFKLVTLWAARSMILRYENDSRGVGKRTSDVVSKLADAAKRVLDDPFVSARQPVRWQSAVARSVCTDLFAMTVVEETPPERREAIRALSKLAIEHAFVVLCGAGAYSTALIDQLAMLAVHQISADETLQHLRAEWIAADALPAFPRALALWSAPEHVRQEPDLAFGLFRRVGRRPLSLRGQQDLQLGRLLTLLDVAVAASWLAGANDLIAKIENLWTEVFEDWFDQTDGRWADAAMTFTSALRGRGSARDAFLADPTFSKTSCHRIIAEQRGI